MPAQKLSRITPLDLAAERLLKSEVAADHLYLEQLYTFAFPGGRVVVAYLAIVRNARLTQSGRAWHSTAPLPKLAAAEREIAAYALKRLRNKITYSNLAFAFLPESFTLSDLQIHL